MQIELAFQNLSKVFNRRVIFENISGHAALGTTLLVTGPNGSGKSTLLKILCGLLRPATGGVELKIDGMKVKPRGINSYLGFMSPELNLYDRLTARENLSFFAAVRGLILGRSQIMELLEYVQLEAAGDQPVSQYSSGMKQRLKLAYALLHRPPVLVLDEPGSNLDQRGNQLLEDVIIRGKEQGIVVLATNNPEEVEKYGQQILHLGSSSGSPG